MSTSSVTALCIITTGGTFEKRYDPVSGSLLFTESYLPGIVERTRLSLPTRIQTLPLQDSLDMQAADRQRIADACQAAPEPALVLVHGTDTMRETAQVLGARFGHGATGAETAKTIVLTGAMVPYSVENSDALFNLGFACAAAQTLAPGVYIAMNGRVFDWDKAVKNRQAGVFEAL